MNILFLSFELESYPLSKLSNKYLIEGYSTHIFNTDEWTFINNKNFYNIYNNKCNSFSNLEEEFVKLNKYHDSIKVDYANLVNFEKEYNISLNKLILTGHILYTSSHFRETYHISSVEIKLKWIELVIKKCLKILDEFKPDVIITLDNNYFVKNLMFYIARKRNIPFLNTMNGRVSNKFIVADNFGLGTSQYFIKEMNTINEKHIEDTRLFIDNINIKNLPSYDSHNKILESYKSNSFFKDLKFVIKSILTGARGALLNKTYYRGRFKPNYLGSMYFKMVWYYIRNYIFKKNLLFKQIKFTKNIEDDLKFYYFPMHVIPESSVLTLSEDYKEECIIKDIASKLPIDTSLVVKENLSMLNEGERPLSFYKNMAQIHNVILIDPSYNSLVLTKKSLGVVSLSGTVMFEAALVNKRAIAVGTPEYNILSNIEKYDKYNTNFSNIDLSKKTDNIEKYIQTVYEIGEDIDMTYLLYGNLSRLEDEKYHEEIVKLKSLFDRYIDKKYKVPTI
jgi:hypothetical protein